MITLDWSFWAQLISALIMMALLNSMLYKPMRRMLQKREEKMSTIRSDVEKFERNAKQLLENFEKKMSEARLAGKKEMEKLKDEARKTEGELMEAASKEAQEKKSQLLAELTSQIEAARKELQAKAESFAVEIAQKLLGRAV